MSDTYGAGQLAFVDSFLGLIPCKVLRVDEPSTDSVTSGQVVARITAARPGFTLGEIVTERGVSIVPRDRVRVRSGQYRITNGYRWADGVPVPRG